MQQMQRVDGAVAAAIGTAARETQRSYQTAWRAWVDFLAQRGRAPGSATGADVQAWAEHMRAAGQRPGTIAARIAACRAVWGRLGGAGRRGPAEDIFALVARLSQAQGGRTGRRKPSATVLRLSAGQVRQLLGVIDRRTASGARDYALLGLLLATGARASEVLRLRVSDVRRTSAGRTEVILAGERRVVAGWVYEAVQAYLHLAGRAPTVGEAGPAGETPPCLAEPLWRPLPSRFQPAAQVAAAGPIGVAQANRILRRWLERAGIDEPEQYSTSSLRGLWMGAG